MAKAYGDALAFIETKAACSEGPQSHIENVRETSENELLRAAGAMGAKKRVSGVANATLEGSGELGGVDRIDPRLFYFRALLDGDRFFSGGERL